MTRKSYLTRVKGDIDTVLVKTLGNPDSPLILAIGLTPLMVASSCGHVSIVDGFIQARADIQNKAILGSLLCSLL